MVEQNNCSGMQKILFVLMIVLGVAVYVGMPWAYRYAQESYNTHAASAAADGGEAGISLFAGRLLCMADDAGGGHKRCA